MTSQDYGCQQPRYVEAGSYERLHDVLAVAYLVRSVFGSRHLRGGICLQGGLCGLHRAPAAHQEQDEVQLCAWQFFGSCNRRDISLWWLGF